MLEPPSLAFRLLPNGQYPVLILGKKPPEAIWVNSIQVNLLRRNWRRRSHCGYPAFFQWVTAEKGPKTAKLVRNEPFSRNGGEVLRRQWPIAPDYPPAVAKEGPDRGSCSGVQGRRLKVPRSEAGMCFRISAGRPGIKDGAHGGATNRRLSPKTAIRATMYHEINRFRAYEVAQPRGEPGNRFAPGVCRWVGSRAGGYSHLARSCSLISP